MASKPSPAACPLTGLRTAFFSSTTNTAPSRTALAGTRVAGRVVAGRVLAPGFRNDTVAFMSGRSKSSGVSTFTRTCTVAFCRLASGLIRSTTPAYCRFG